MVFGLFGGGGGGEDSSKGDEENRSNNKDEETQQLLAGDPKKTDAVSYDTTTTTTNEDDNKKEQATTTTNPDSAEETPVARFDGESLWDDVWHLREGSIPQSVVVAIVTALACGVGAYLYYVVLEFLLEFLWHTIPEYLIGDEEDGEEGIWPTDWLSPAFYIPLLGFGMSIGLGVTVKILGEPGDLAYTIHCVHEHAFVHLNHVTPMCLASLFSIVGGGSIGPEAPLVAICAALGGNISFYLFKQTNKNVMRKHTLMGMSAALAAFFGAPLGGSLFALEVCSKFGIEYFEHTIECIFCGLLAMIVFRTLTGIPPGPVWTFETPPLPEADITLTLVGCVLGLLGAAVAAVFVHYHWCVLSVFQKLDLLQDTNKAIPRALLGGIVIYGLGMLIPHTLFWGEAEFQTLWNLQPAKTLEHVYPTSGLIGFEMDTFGKCLLVGFAKLITISFSVAGGYRGGFIFPFFSSGAAFGRAVLFVFPQLPSTVVCLAFAAGINVAVTKTAMATTLILCYLSGEQNALPPVLASSMVSLLVSSYMPFIKTQVSREDEEIEEIRRARAQQRAQQQRAQRARVTFRSATRRLIHARRLYSNQREEPPTNEPIDEDDIPLSETKPSFRHHAQRGYLV